MHCSWRKKNNPTHVSWLTAWKRRGVHTGTEHCHSTLSHPSLSLSTSSASSVLKQKIRIGFTGNHQNIPIFLSSDRKQLEQFLCPLPAKLPLLTPNAKILLQSREADPTSPIPDAIPSAVHPISVLDKWYSMSGALKRCHLKLLSSIV